MIRFAHPYFIYGLILIPFFIILFWLYLRWKQKALRTFGDISVIRQLMPGVSKARPIVKFILLMTAFIFLIIGLADPQIGSKLEKVNRKGVDIMICLDVSNSMLAEDIKPNRLEKAKFAISKLIDKLEDDRIGIVVFAGQAFTQLPITADHAAAKMFVSTINPGLIPVQGTAIGEAIKLAQSSFSEDNKKNKAIIVISDGENHEDDAIAESIEVNKKGTYVYSIGIGSPEGVPIMIPGSKNQYLKDNSGSTVVTKLDEILLQQIAVAGKGSYVRATSSETGLNIIFNDINKMEKKDYESKVYSDFEDRFQYLIAIALLLLIIELTIFERKNKWFSRFNPFIKDSLLSFKTKD